MVVKNKEVAINSNNNKENSSSATQSIIYLYVFFKKGNALLRVFDYFYF